MAAVSIVTVLPVGPIAGAPSVIATPAAPKENDMNVIVMRVHLVDHVDMKWTATAWPDHHTNTAAIKIVSPVRPSVATSTAQGLTIPRARHSIRV
jgi:hypothetical protein